MGNPKKAREYLIEVTQSCHGFLYHAIDFMGEGHVKDGMVYVREILPTDLTPGQLRELIRSYKERYGHMPGKDSK